MKETHSISNVFDAALLRLDIVFSDYEKVCISLSGGKSSTVLLHLAATVAKAHGKKLTVLFIDQEAQHTQTISHIQRLKQLYREVIENFYWIALPLTTENNQSDHSHTWISWEDNVEWWRIPPAGTITDQHVFPFYHYAMTEGNFTSAFLNWLSSGKTLAFVMGTLSSDAANNDSQLTQKSYDVERNELRTKSETSSQIHTLYPLFDWQSQDVWLFNSLSKAPYNPLYDLMYRSGAPRSGMKIQEPFEQQTTEISQCKTIPAQQAAFNRTGPCDNARKPSEGTWQNHATFLLNSMPQKMADQFRANIDQYLSWHRSRGFLTCIPDEEACATEEHDIVSWEKICTMILSNDYRSLALTASPSPSEDATLCCSRKKSRRRRSNSNEAIFL
ncbi:phosphoadenosine phosphosulfate reductase family protein [Candidatus Symbiopectobacterium sp. NZEC127]|uniref:phosphoadenosine phosphosulfate reductase domain-containing protein n=1 Tax=Candidatus Symbiopectobacterium sp. NZEC127 TaxID=2820472 RepID=UPI002226193F|nr:phosphoadenosine phosphosulfate reductase family protein [Candidatus Symbiopectobacterium sp. NZEC127]MCW2488091.1 phosphoadenosine phosphosulfate reductase family protein [Candidatus Symbiopectobacterium sp. NZEC127]